HLDLHSYKRVPRGILPSAFSNRVGGAAVETRATLLLVPPCRGCSADDDEPKKMACAARPSSRYPSLDSRSSSMSPSSSGRKLSTFGRPAPAAVGASGDGGSFSSSSQALVRMKPGDLAAKNGQNLGSMVRKFMEKRSKVKDLGKVVLPPARVVEDLKKAAAGGSAGKGSNLAVLHRKLFQRGKSGDGTPAKALTEVKSNTRTLAMVLRSERELLDQNKEYEAEILELRSLLEDKEREVNKLKDLCLKQRQEIKALKDAILFPDVMNAQIQMLLEKQGSELKQAKQVIPTLQKQVTSLSGQLQCLAVDLAEVKADKYAVRSHVVGHGFSPRTPAYDHEPTNSWEFSSGDQMTPGIPDDMFLKDMNPCLTPCFPKTKSKEFGDRMGYKFAQGDDSFGSSSMMSSSDTCFGSLEGKLSKSSEHCQKPRVLGSGGTRKTRMSDGS
ncbi:hypothetical protein Taro_028965, partial [Colocasia esculenta]|nr:hypothetical protein [Colocasia esculenta]